MLSVVAGLDIVWNREVHNFVLYLVLKSLGVRTKGEGVEQHVFGKEVLLE